MTVAARRRRVAPNRIFADLFLSAPTPKTTNSRVKRSAYWFLGEYCRQLTGAPADDADEDAAHSPPSAGQSPSSDPKPGSSGNDLLDVWSSPAATRSEGGAGAARPMAGLNGLEAGGGAVAHPVLAAMNGATVSILMRLKHAAMFEDFQVLSVGSARVAIHRVFAAIGVALSVSPEPFFAHEACCGGKNGSPRFPS